MTTLLCIPLAVLLARRLPFPVTGLLLCFCKPAVTAIETPAVEDRNEKKPRRKGEENSLTEFVNIFLEGKVLIPFVRWVGRVNCLYAHWIAGFHNLVFALGRGS
jgi:hypothetical protein